MYLAMDHSAINRHACNSFDLFPGRVAVTMKYSAAVSSSRRKSRKVCTHTSVVLCHAIPRSYTCNKSFGVAGSLHSAVQCEAEAYERSAELRPEEQVRGM